MADKNGVKYVLTNPWLNDIRLRFGFSLIGVIAIQNI